MQQYIDQAVTEYLDGSDKDLDESEVEAALREKVETVESKLMEEASDEQKVDYAMGMLNAEDLRQDRTGFDGEKMHLQILSVGHRGLREDMGKDDIDTVIAHGIIHGPIGEDGKEKAGKAVFLLRKSHIDVLDAQQKFSSLAELEGTFEVEEAWELAERNFYRVYSTDDTEIRETEIDAIPSSRDEKNAFLRKAFDEVELASLAESKSGISAFDPDSGFAHDYGADIKRIEGTIVDYYIPDDRRFGVMTLMDDSVMADDLEETDLVDDGSQTPGLTVWADPDYHIKYGEQSVVDVYGVVEVNDDGQVVMNAAGVVPIIPIDLDDGDQSSSGVEATESSI